MEFPQRDTLATGMFAVNTTSDRAPAPAAKSGWILKRWLTLVPLLLRLPLKGLLEEQSSLTFSERARACVRLLDNVFVHNNLPPQ